MSSHLEDKPYKPPNWAGKPPPGLHLDVLKGDKLIQKYMIDEKNYYLFGRNTKMCDFTMDHASCSRMHAALVWHKTLNRMFLIDMGSVHGTYIRSIRLDPDKPQHVPIDSAIHFGASTRNYILREKPLSYYGLDNANSSILNEDPKTNASTCESILPEDEIELDNLTEFNTAHNRRVTTLGLEDSADTQKTGGNLSSINKNLRNNSYSSLNPLLDSLHNNKKDKRYSIRFSDIEDIINPEDIDPTIGRYRNMVQTVVVPKPSPDTKNPLALQNSKTLHPKAMVNLMDHKDINNTVSIKLGSGFNNSLYDDILPDQLAPKSNMPHYMVTSAHHKIGHRSQQHHMSSLLPNPAPNVDIPQLPCDEKVEPEQNNTNKRKVIETIQNESASINNNANEVYDNGEYHQVVNFPEPSPLPLLASAHKKKKYAKEAWPGKRTTTSSNNLPTSLLG